MCKGRKRAKTKKVTDLQRCTMCHPSWAPDITQGKLHAKGTLTGKSLLPQSALMLFFQVSNKLPTDIHVQQWPVIHGMVTWGICPCVVSTFPCTSGKDDWNSSEQLSTPVTSPCTVLRRITEKAGGSPNLSHASQHSLKAQASLSACGQNTSIPPCPEHQEAQHCHVLFN